MFSTFILFGIFLGLIILQLILWAFLLRLGLGWAKVANVTTRRIVFTTATVMVLQLLLLPIFGLSTAKTDSQLLLIGLLNLGAAVLVPCLVIVRVFKVSSLRSLQAWLPTLLSSAVAFLFVVLVLKPFLFEAFVNPTNSMAPTLLGNTWRSRCSKCGEVNYCSPADPRMPPDPIRLICGNFHVDQVSELPQDVFPPDRFLVAKFLAPKRWDLVVFQYPQNPSTRYVKRLVGLPGETIHIEDGAVWVNGTKLEPPPSLHGIEYLSELPDFGGELWGSKERPAALEKDEYFVLGDFSAQSNDSRLWKHSPTGKHPFAVPESHLRGVVTHVYWPPQRWRIFR